MAMVWDAGSLSWLLKAVCEPLNWAPESEFYLRRKKRAEQCPDAALLWKSCLGWVFQTVRLAHRREGEDIGGSTKAKACVDAFNQWRNSDRYRWSKGPESWAFPELTDRNASATSSGPREAERNLSLTSATQFAYMISGRGGLVAKHRAVRCWV